MKSKLNFLYNVYFAVIILIVLTLIVNPNRKRIVFEGFLLLFLWIPTLFWVPWENLKSISKTYSRLFISVIWGTIIVQLIIFTLKLSMAQINYDFFTALWIIFTIIIYIKFSELYLSKALESGGLLWRVFWRDNKT